jgi:hypothetical protein
MVPTHSEVCLCVAQPPQVLPHGPHVSPRQTCFVNHLAFPGVVFHTTIPCTSLSQQCGEWVQQQSPMVPAQLTWGSGIIWLYKLP